MFHTVNFSSFLARKCNNADASYLDKWSLDQLHSLINESLNDPALKTLLSQDKLVIFLHLAGCDANGHAHRPYSSIYLNNVNVIDTIAKSVYTLMENYYNDNQTAYVFTADHGITDKGINCSFPNLFECFLIILFILDSCCLHFLFSPLSCVLVLKKHFNELFRFIFLKNGKQ